MVMSLFPQPIISLSVRNNNRLQSQFSSSVGDLLHVIQIHVVTYTTKSELVHVAVHPKLISSRLASEHETGFHKQQSCNRKTATAEATRSQGSRKSDMHIPCCSQIHVGSDKMNLIYRQNQHYWHSSKPIEQFME